MAKAAAWFQPGDSASTMGKLLRGRRQVSPPLLNGKSLGCSTYLRIHKYFEAPRNDCPMKNMVLNVTVR